MASHSTDLGTFLDTYGEAIAGAVAATYPPLYDAAARRGFGRELGHLRRRPLGAQADAIRAVALSLRTQGSTNVIAEMGTGKTYIAVAAATLAGCRRAFVLCPPHLVGKWAREIGQTIPGARVATVRSLADLRRVAALADRQPTGLITRAGRSLALPEFVICSREVAKLGYRWTPAAAERPLTTEDHRLARDESGRPLRALCCPDCFGPLLDDEGVPLTWAELAAKRRRCPACGGALWAADRAGPRRYPLADYIRRRLPGHFDLLIADEVHEFKARGSAQGLAAGALAGACGRTLTLTGTVFGGYASTLFHLLWRFSPAIRAEFGYRDEARWVSRYGIVHRITKKDPDAHTADGRHSKRRTYPTRIVEKPGVSPAILFHLIPNSVFLRLADVARDLPPYEESVTLVPLDRGDSAAPVAPSQERCYRDLAQGLLTAVKAALARGSKRLLGTYLQTLLTYPDACTRGETVLDALTGEVVARAPALPEGTIYPKERALLDLVARERERGRRVLIYLTHTETRDLSPRLAGLLEAAGSRVAILKAATVPPDRREGWVETRVREGADVLLVHPRLVATGLDLLAFPTVVWYEPEYSVYLQRQASRRSWRIGQRDPVAVHYLVYRDTLQAEALALVSAKLRAALLVEGDLPADGLASLDDDGQDLHLALARRLASGGAGEAESLERLFAQNRALEASSGDTLDHNEEEEISPQIAVVDAAQIGAVHTLRFEELALLMRSARVPGRRKPVAVGQLSLFGS